MTYEEYRQLVASLAQCGLDALDVGEDRKAVLYMAAAREMMQELELLLVEIDRVGTSAAGDKG